MRIFLKILSLLVLLLMAFNLFIDVNLLIDSASTGEKLHPQLMEHWPFNIINFVIGLWLFYYYWYSKQ